MQWLAMKVLYYTHTYCGSPIGLGRLKSIHRANQTLSSMVEPMSYHTLINSGSVFIIQSDAKVEKGVTKTQGKRARIIWRQKENT